MAADGTQGAGFEIGVDTGGTFTDVVARGPDGALRVMKVASTPRDPGAAILSALELMGRDWGIAPADIGRFVHGTTVATNAVLERKGARAGLITTRGFRDVLEIGRNNRRDEELYSWALTPNTPVFLAPGPRRKEVSERITAEGAVAVPLDEDEVAAAADALVADGCEAIAIAFLFSFLNPAHERRAAEILRARHPGVPLSLSHEVDPAFREYERTAVTCFDAYVKPVMRRYLMQTDARLRAQGVACGLQVIQSRGGISGAGTATLRPVRLLLSGPAGGVIGGQSVGAQCGEERLITLDIGGTSSDIALIEGGRPLIRQTFLIDGFTIRVPMVDVNTIGAGGGSIAWVDKGGGLRVGPHSAGADPGPACYGQGGDEATVTDASVVLGYLNPGNFAGGRMTLDPDRARAAIEARIARPLGLGVEEAALGIHRVVNAQMAEGIRFVSIQRGHDPRRFALVPLGGAGGLHGIPLARALSMTRLIVPEHPGVLSAQGLLDAPVEHEAAAGLMRPLSEVTRADLSRICAELDAACAALMAEEATGGGVPEVRHSAELCYIGQSHYLEVPVDLAAADPTAALYEAFLAAHAQVYGHAVRRPVRVVNLRSVHRVRRAPAPAAAAASAAEPRPETSRAILVEGADGPVTARVLDRLALAPGQVVTGPAIVEQADTTILIEPGWQASLAPGRNLLLTRT
jgi:N-methylhydantoinase A/oxoprolinase/acetone carboxylase beta subunit